MNEKIVLSSYGKTNIEKPLHQLIPLKAPATVYIDPSNICNFRCAFCPTGDQELIQSINRPRGVMDFELFKKIADDLLVFNGAIKRVNLCKDGEPLLNQNVSKMVSYIKSKNVAENVDLTTNGSLLDKVKAIELIEAELDGVRISVEHVDDKGYKEITNTETSYNTIKENVSFLFNEKTKRNSSLKVHVKVIDTGLTELQKEKFLNDFSSISDTINIETLMGWSASNIKDFTLGKGKDIKTGQDGKTPLKTDRIVCPNPFKTIAISFNGLVSVCCCDWSLGTIIGDAKLETIADIWNGEKLRNIRMMHLKNQRNEIEACGTCQYMTGISDISDLDEYRDELIKLL